MRAKATQRGWMINASQVSATAGATTLPSRWRTATLDTYDGQRWTPTLTLRPIGRRLGPDQPGTIGADIEFQSDDVAFVPLPGNPIQIGADVQTDAARTVVQLVDRHGRDSRALAERYDVPLYVTPFAGVPGSPFAVVRVVNVPGWREVALWWPAVRALAVGDALGTASYFRAPREAIAVHPVLRLLPPRALGRLEPEHILCGHGEGLHGDQAASALDEALRTSRRRIPRWLVGLARDARRR